MVVLDMREVLRAEILRGVVIHCSQNNKRRRDQGQCENKHYKLNINIQVRNEEQWERKWET